MFDQNLAQTAADKLSASGLKIVVAESLTGGLLSAALTSVPGSSAYFEGGLVAYSNQLKVEWLNVPVQLLTAQGAVSRECALAMVEGARRKTGADLALATTGTAGPAGGTAQKPVGTVWLAVSGPKGQKAVLNQFAGDRSQISSASVDAALRLLLEALP